MLNNYNFRPDFVSDGSRPNPFGTHAMRTIQQDDPEAPPDPLLASFVLVQFVLEIIAGLTGAISTILNDAAELAIRNDDEFIDIPHLERVARAQPDINRPWPIAPRPFFEEAFGSWLGRIAARYKTNVGLIWKTGTGLAMPTFTSAGWILFPPVSPPS
jgi:hypothetical protein